MCITAPFCAKALALEHNGDVYSCDHLVYPEYKIGNIKDIHEGDLAFSLKQVKFGLDKADKLPNQCKKCKHKKLCWGECPKNRILRSNDNEPGLNYLCEGLFMFYEHIQDDLLKITNSIQNTNY